MRAILLSAAALAFLGAGCDRPAEPAQPLRLPEPEVPKPASVVPIPEEFQSPARPVVAIPPTPRILFAATDFQVKTRSGIQGIMAGETVNVIREVGDDVVAQYGEVEFIKSKSFFSPTFVGSRTAGERGGALASEPTPPAVPVAEPKAEPKAGLKAESPDNAPQPSAPAAEPVDTIGLAAPIPAADPALPGENPAAVPAPALSAEEKKMAALADSIRGINDQIRTAQEKAEQPGKTPSRSEKRQIERMKADRDELSRQLTTLGKP